MITPSRPKHVETVSFVCDKDHGKSPRKEAYDKLKAAGLGENVSLNSSI
jgi:hypothetical protein